MARKARQRISYVLPLANSAGGHRLGVNGLAVDPDNSILYSGGRDGVICAWNLHLDLNSGTNNVFDDTSKGKSPVKEPKTTIRQQVQAHTHWVNDIVLADNANALVSASSDTSVKVWRPNAQEVRPPQTIGLHSDYVKCLATPSPGSTWVASGGLDRKIALWDLSGAGKRLEIAVGEDENSSKGSVYGLAVTNSILASGGPESIVRVWDPRSSKQITKFVGHTDNIRDVLVTQDGDNIITASSDQTVKVWCMTAGRCMHTLTMHNDSVWSLYSNRPDLSVFYSSDRSGLVAKTDTRGCAEVDEGLSIALFQEHEGVNKVIQSGSYLWTATSNSSINRWVDVNFEKDIRLPEFYSYYRSRSGTNPSRHPSIQTTHAQSPPNDISKKELPPQCILRLSNTAPYPIYQSRDGDSAFRAALGNRKPSEVLLDNEPSVIVPYRAQPDFSIEGQNGLIKHFMLNNRRQVLTCDTAGEVMLWDLIKCVPIRSFGKRHLDDVIPEVNTTESVAHWVSVDTRTGSLSCVLEENHCFDAEMYADELDLQENIDFREDQRIIMGKWVLRYLFANLVDEEIKRDEAFRTRLLNSSKQSLQRANAPGNITIPHADINGWKDAGSGPTSASTIKATNGFPLLTPGLAIGVVTPGYIPTPSTTQFGTTLASTAEEGATLERTSTQYSQSHPRTSGDYFSAPPVPQPATTPGGTVHQEALPQSPVDVDKETTKEGNALFGKKFKMSFKMKGLTKTQTIEQPKPVVADEKSQDSDSQSSKTDERQIEDNLFGTIQKIRYAYEDQLEAMQNVVSSITPSLPNETPVLKLPPNTTILIQEDRPDSGGVSDLFEGEVGTVGMQADLVEKVAPMWLGDVLLRNTIPLKDIVKISFLLEPWQGQLPAIATDGNNRLNANRMLRARKILSYVAERIEPQPEKEDPGALRPEEYLELYCQNQRVPTTMTLATIRTHIWRGGGDVLLYYKSNGRKEIKHALPSTSSAVDEEKSVRSEESIGKKSEESTVQ
ncbi:WD40 repeat-like protein [Patellaria atrata CBS 101060]|uniref:WD40 repeat-like protein n=1 Tax=Patellaria atrata CBS 101060 TaxID=1346257 RepID=A0A9P4SI51_9PEZI|nr:WD40 repeat-like protein [Patellaria atrata CBS 101060]